MEREIALELIRSLNVYGPSVTISFIEGSCKSFYLIAGENKKRDFRTIISALLYLTLIIRSSQTQFLVKAITF